jgi:hypothetical protein
MALRLSPLDVRTVDTCEPDPPVQRKDVPAVHKVSVVSVVIIVAAAVTGCAIDPVDTLPPEKAALESFAAAFQSAAPRADKSTDPGPPLVIVTDPPPDVGLLDQVNAPAPGGIFTPTNAWAGWIDARTYVQVWAGDQPGSGGGGLMLVIRRPGIGDGAHLDPNAEPTASYVPPPSESGPLTIVAIRDGKLVVRTSTGTEWLFDPGAGAFLEAP